MEKLEIKNHIRLIELFAGIGSQAMALRNIGADFETYRTCEWWVQPNASYKAIHYPDDNTDYSGEMTKEQFILTLKERLRSTDMSQVKADVRDFIIEPRELDIWSNDYFLQLSDMITWK